MNAPDDTLRAAIVAHQAGRLAEAEVGYRRVLRKNPNDSGALYGLGLLHYHQGSVGSALEYMSQSLQIAPSNARVWNTLGSMYSSLGREHEAKDAYERATKASPTMSEAWYNLGICQRNENDIDTAVGSLYAATVCDPPYLRAYEALASLLYQEGRESEAAEVYRLWIAHDPENAKARHMFAASSGEAAPARASDDYIRQHFDASASTFDSNLKHLDYRSHEIVVAALAKASRDPARELDSVLDAGCGTGLCGPSVRPLCKRLVGVDLSPRMIDRARLRECYDELIVSELSAFMRSRAHSFSAIVCADTLVYFGALDEPLAAARRALRANGLLAFTVEAADSDDYRLGVTGRYSHSPDYLRRSLSEAGFAVMALSPVTLRQERSRDVAGILMVAHLP